MATPPTFSAGAVLTAAQMNAVGMWLIQTKTVSAASEISVPGVFTSDYENYRIITRLYGSSNTYTAFQFYTGTTTALTTTYWRRGYKAGATLALETQSSTSDWYLNDMDTSSTVPNYSVLDVFGPNKAARPSAMLWSYNHVVPFTLNYAGGNENTTAKTGFRIITAGGVTMTGVVRVYGYRD